MIKYPEVTKFALFLIFCVTAISLVLDMLYGVDCILALALIINLVLLGFVININ